MPGIESNKSVDVRRTSIYGANLFRPVNRCPTDTIFISRPSARHIVAALDVPGYGEIGVLRTPADGCGSRPGTSEHIGAHRRCTGYLDCICCLFLRFGIFKIISFCYFCIPFVLLYPLSHKNIPSPFPPSVSLGNKKASCTMSPRQRAGYRLLAIWDTTFLLNITYDVNSKDYA